MKTVFRSLASRSLIGAAAIAVACTSAMAQAPKPIKQHKAWGAYSYTDSQAGKVCYILSIPTAKEPVDRDHGDVFFLVSQKPNGQDGFEPQVEVGYSLKADSEVTVTIDGKSFAMFTQGRNAWLKDLSQEPAFVGAMRAGSQMTVAGQSSRGTNTSYTYSLSGVTAALRDVSNCER